MDNKKRVRRGESFGRVGVDRTISNSLKSPTRQKQKQLCTGDIDNDNDSTKHTVKFTEETPRTYLCSHYDEGMTPEQQEGRRKELWYSRRDFEDFLRDRVATIRLLKMVQGDATALREHCPDVCLRGLEPYECNSLNQELQCQRQWHQRVVLAEQSLQKKQKQDLPERIRRLAVERSEWAGQRARQLASMDEMEVKLADAEPQMRRKSLATAQIGMENLMLTQQHQQQRRRATLSLVNTASRNPVGLSSGRVPVDLAILKEWNAKFMDEIRKKGGVPSSSAPPTTTVASPPNMPSVSSLSDKTAQSRMALQRGVATSMATSQLGYGEMLTSKDATAACFRFPVRRDSLVGFRRESLMASRAAALTGGAAAASSSTSPSAATGGFRFPVRRDSLSNVHWN